MHVSNNIVAMLIDAAETMDHHEFTLLCVKWLEDWPEYVDVLEHLRKYSLWLNSASGYTTAQHFYQQN